MSAALVRPPGESSIPRRRAETQCSSRFMSSVAWSVLSANGKAHVIFYLPINAYM